MHGGPGRSCVAVLATTCLISLAKAEVSDAESELAFNQGTISGTAKACGLDWQALSFRPMMAYWRRIGKLDRDTAVLAAMHGVGQGQAEAALSGRDCTEAMRRKIRSQLPFKR